MKTAVLYWIAHIILCSMLLHFETIAGAKIIMTSPQFSSHISRQLELGAALVRAGHEVHVALGSRFTKRQMIEEMGIQLLFYHIPDDVIYGVSEEYESFLSETTFRQSTDMPFTSTLTNRDCTYMMADVDFLEKVRNLKFDLALVESFLLSPCTLLLPRYLGISFVSLSTSVKPWQMRIPALPSFYPAINPLFIFDEATILGRLKNFLAFIVIEIGFVFPGVRNTTLLERYAPELHSWGDLVRQAELYLVTSDHHMGNPLPAFPNFISIAGLTCNPSKKFDPKLETIFNSSKNGVIIMSFGSMVYNMPKNVTVKFLDAFSRLKQTVVARLPEPEGVTIPGNVKLLSWLPQNDMLGHPNTRLFITHCGSNGQHEALYHGVPMVGFPLFAEQHMNAHSADVKGFGLTMKIHNFTADDLYANINEVLNNPKYRSAIRKASVRFRDQPMSSKEKAIFWIEYVVKYGGSHLRSPAVNQPLYQFLMLDILAVLLVLAIALFSLAKLIVCVIFKRLCRSKQAIPKLKSQ